MCHAMYVWRYGEGKLLFCGIVETLVRTNHGKVGTIVEIRSLAMDVCSRDLLGMIGIYRIDLGSKAPFRTTK